ncbi:phospholipid carrier-dependent glycosyltransferase [Arenimonas terrae]|uniref:Phospholipid carrier-dependent glycosyltransferase n=1 Tax=Arenimonas terrae TaxID=2546226 RepID=A0A5C4RPH8_9GAMM|nr:phospholipid carrier-dependent glycosyltransferase [Arenimonas terrae]TNJ32854.1 phospholipid carrier-dependent glycosyltransferase [Arenimonas terrae]
MHDEQKAAPSRAVGMVLILLLAALAVLRSHGGTRLDGYTVDEPWHVVAGVSYLRTGDFRLNPEHPPLVKLVAGAAQSPDFVLPPFAALTEKSQERDWVERTMFLENDAAASQRATRAGLWTFHALLLVALGALVWRAMGLAWALGTLAFLAIEPTVAAHLPVAMTDLPLALTLAVAAVAAGLLLAEWRWHWVLATGVALGLVLGSKHSALAGLAGLGLVLGIGVLAGLRRSAGEFARRLLRVGIAGLLGVALLWAMYGFHFHAGPDGSDGFNRGMADKVADLNIPHWREGIAFADATHLLPRAYLWGLADTVRAGVEGRGQGSHLVWGVSHKGRPPWFTWPSILVSKLPLALMAMALLGLVALRWLPLPAAARWALGAALGVSTVHLLALMSGQGTYGGIRHALPIVVLLALPAGALVAAAWAQRRRALRVAALVPLAAALVMTVGEPRAWEYHNELAGGSEGAFRQFGNEGIDLGQRWPEIKAYHDAVIAPEGATLYSDYWFMEEQAIAARTNYRRKVDSIDDTNAEGVYEGYFLYGMHMTLPWPDWGWDPAVNLKGLELVQRIGYVAVYKGRRQDPQGRAGDVYQKVMEHLYKQGGGRDDVVAARLDETLDQLPFHVGAAIELGNAYLRLGDVAAAAEAYRRPLLQEKMPVEPLVKSQIEAQLERLATPGITAAEVKPLRNPWME